MTGMVMIPRSSGCGGNGGTKTGSAGASEDEQNQLSLMALLIAALRKSMVACRVDQRDEQGPGTNGLCNMEIGWPTNVQHLTHVTFDRFQGFLGLPVEFQVEIPCRVPGASVSVFGVSAESMQCSYDSFADAGTTIQARRSKGVERIEQKLVVRCYLIFRRLHINLILLPVIMILFLMGKVILAYECYNYRCLETGEVMY